MARYDGATIEVVKWTTYNPRTDSKKPSWFRFENDLAIGSAFFGLDCEQKWLWVFILSLVSKANGEPIVWNAAYCQQLTGIKPKKQDETLEVFEKFVRLRVSRNVTQSSTDATNPLRDETNETRRTDETDLTSTGGEDADMHALAILWNENCGTLPRVRECGKDRTRKAKARFEEKPDPDYWIGVIKRLAASHFCQGKGKTGWRADFDFMLQEGAATKTLEGKYDDRKGGGGGAFQRTEDLDDEMEKLTGNSA